MGMMKKSDLVYKDYSWTAYGDDDPEVKGTPDSTLFNRKEGYEVLYLINKMAEIYEFKTVSKCQKIEKMLHDHLPGHIRSQNNVVAWVLNNCNRQLNRIFH